MKRKRILVYGIPASLLVVSIVYLLCPPQLKLLYVLNYLHISRIDPQLMREGSSWVCPLCGSMLDRIVINPVDPVIADEGWRFAFYCSNEDVFWVLDFPGGMASAQWYGPFNAYWKLTNAIAVLILAICCVTMVTCAWMDLYRFYKHQPGYPA